MNSPKTTTPDAEECMHEETDKGVCLYCGKDCDPNALSPDVEKRSSYQQATAILDQAARVAINKANTK